MRLWFLYGTLEMSETFHLKLGTDDESTRKTLRSAAFCRNVSPQDQSQTWSRLRVVVVVQVNSFNLPVLALPTDNVTTTTRHWQIKLFCLITRHAPNMSPRGMSKAQEGFNEQTAKQETT